MLSMHEPPESPGEAAPTESWGDRTQSSCCSVWVGLSATGTFQTFIGMASWIGLVRVTASFGAEALAG